MEYIVEGLLIALGAPVACITPLVGAAIIGGYSYNAYKEARETASRRGTPIYEEFYFWIGIVLAIFSLYGIWIALNVLIAISG